MKIALYFIYIILTYFFFQKSQFIGTKLNLIDRPDGLRKKHSEPTPVIGGLIFFFLLFFLLALDFYDFNSLFIYKFERKIDKIILFFVIFSFFILGVCDDKYDLRPITKIASYIFILFFLFTLMPVFVIKNIKLSFFKEIDLFQFSTLFSILIFIFFINAINMFDGINLQASSLFLIVWGYIGLKFGFNEFIIYIIIFLLIFSYFNFKRKAFLGDCGIYLLSITAYLYLSMTYNLNKKELKLDEILCLFLLPTIDCLRVIFIRFKNNKNPFDADNLHFQHLLIKNFNYYKTLSLIVLGYLFPITLFSFARFNFGLVLFIFLFFYFYLINFKSKN
jgi:UDP-N-acetylmuramyl pentapeptide phosphotransferase/UDP-N-acetylglucosamine-1-phosphate transferase